MIIYRVENLTENFSEIEDLLEGHWQEIAGYKDHIKLEPDWNAYAKMDEADMVKFYTVRDDGKMVGYSLFLIAPLIHYKSTKVAANDIIYIRPEYRKGWVGIKLLKFCHNHLKASGLIRITWHVKPDHDWTKILIRMGYKIEELVVGICLTG